MGTYLVKEAAYQQLTKLAQAVDIIRQVKRAEKNKIRMDDKTTWTQDTPFREYLVYSPGPDRMRPKKMTPSNYAVVYMPFEPKGQQFRLATSADMHLPVADPVQLRKSLEAQELKAR